MRSFGADHGFQSELWVKRAAREHDRRIAAGNAPRIRSHRVPLYAILLLVATSYSCSNGGGSSNPERTGEPVRWAYQQPENTGDGWVTASLTDVGMDLQPITDLINRLHDNQDHLVHSIVIAVDGQLVFEEYFAGRTHPTFGETPIVFDRETTHGLSSVTKSFTATLLGRAITEGYVVNENQAIFDYLPDYSDLNIGQKSDVTLRHLVSMSGGLQWDEWSYPLTDLRNDLIAWYRHQGDLNRFVLERPIVADPGTVFVYNGGLTNVLGEIIGRATGQRLDRYSAPLFARLGIVDFSWYFIRPEYVYASGDLSMRPRDMAKLGQLYLQRGVWQGEQILSDAWVEASASPAFILESGFNGHTGYGYGWWQKSSAYGDGVFAAAGWGDQAIIVVPQFDMVVVFTGGSYWDAPLLTSHDMMLTYILPAAR